jgi:penicillin-binding protein 1A
MAVDNHTGGIRVLVGGRDHATSKFNRAYFAERQVGSSVKPFVYAAAFSAGLDPNAPVSDNRIGPGELPKAFANYSPANSDDTYRGILPAKDGLILSRNTMSVRVGAVAGIERVRENILAAGIGSDVPKYPSIFLGSFSGSLRALTVASSPSMLAWMIISAGSRAAASSRRPETQSCWTSAATSSQPPRRCC